MVLLLLRWLDSLAWAGGTCGLEKITLRASLAAVLSFAVALAAGPRVIGWLAARFRERIREDSPALFELHRDKSATPTMGGLFLVAGLIAATLVLGDLENPFVGVALVLTVGLGALGVVDDLGKLRGRGGLSARAKLAGQVLLAAWAAGLLHGRMGQVPGGLDLHVPLLGPFGGIGWWFIPLATGVIVASSNAVNLADGLDGLAGGCLIFAAAAMTLVAYGSGHVELAAYLHLPRVPGAGEMTVLAGAMIGALLGFLWFNCHPAQVFMGDTGSLPLGGLLGLLAVVTRQELLLLLVGGVFVAEASSVIIQVGSFKLRGRRVFRCAPLHHHFQLLGWPESRIVVRFWIASAVCAILGLATLKLNAPPARPSSVAESPHVKASTEPAQPVRVASRSSHQEGR